MKQSNNIWKVLSKRDYRAEDVVGSQEEKDDIIRCYGISRFVSWCPARVNIKASNPSACHPNRQEKVPVTEEILISDIHLQDLSFSLQHLTHNKEGWWADNGKTLLANGSSSVSWEAQGTPTPRKIKRRAAVAECQPNSKLGLFLLEKSKLEKLAETRSVGRELGFPSSCSARTACNLFYSAGLPMELTQVQSVKIKYEAHVTDHSSSLTQLSVCKVSVEAWKHWNTQDPQMGSSGVHRWEVPV